MICLQNVFCNLLDHGSLNGVVFTERGLGAIEPYRYNVGGICGRIHRGVAGLVGVLVRDVVVHQVCMDQLGGGGIARDPDIETAAIWKCYGCSMNRNLRRIH